MTRSERLEEIRQTHAAHLSAITAEERRIAAIALVRADIPWLLSEVERLENSLFEAIQAHTKTMHQWANGEDPP